MANRILFNEIGSLSLEHLWLVAIAVIAAIAISAPLAVFLVRNARLRRWTLGVVNVIQTVPSLALFGFLIPLPFIGGVGKRTAIIALIFYALLPILRNMVVGILGVDPGVRDSAVAMGMTDRQILRTVEVPLALPNHPCRHSYRDGHYNWNGDHCGGDRWRRPGYVRFPRNCNGRFENNSGWRRAGRAYGDHGG